MKILTFIWFCVALATANAQEWEWQNPLPQGNDLYDVQFLDNSVGYAVGRGQTILKTNNGGANWQVLNFGQSDLIFTKLQMQDIQKGWIIEAQWLDDAESRILKTSDGWNSRTPVFEDSGKVNCMLWQEENKGWAGTRNGLYQTSDGGQNWIKMVDSLMVVSVFFLNDSLGWFGSGNRVYHTTDGGQNWNYSSIPGYNARYPIESKFFNSQIGWINVHRWGPNDEQGIIYKTTDGGLTWIEQTLSSHSYYSYYVDFDMLDTLTGFTCEDNGVFLRTDDGGDNWTVIDTIKHTQAFSFNDNMNAGGVGDFGAIYHTSDGGLDWQKQFTGHIVTLSDYPDFEFVDQMTGFATTWQGLLKTTDAGNSWQVLPVNSEPYEFIWGIDFIDDLKGWLSLGKGGGWGSILMTEDGGQTFETQLDSTHRSLDIFFIDENIGWAGSSSGLINFTQDGGQNWIQKPVPATHEISNIFFVDTLTGWASDRWTLIHTSDGGQNWIIQNLGISNGILNMEFFNSLYGFVLCENSVFRTLNGGQDWELVLSYSYPDDIRFFDVDFLDSSLIYLVGESIFHNCGRFFKSTDGGGSWELVENIPIASPLFGISSPQADKVWILGRGGAIMHTDISSPVRDKPISHLPEDFQLFSNYPNPFNPETTIEFYLPQAAEIQLKIYNVLGQKIRTLVAERKIAGSHQVEWDGRDDAEREVASGVYLYRLITEEFVQSRKMVLIR